MLVLHDVHQIYDRGIICDTHVHSSFENLEWADIGLTADNASRQVEDWLPKEFWKDINPVFASIRQLWENKSNRSKMIEIAADMEFDVNLIVQDMDIDADEE